MPNAFEQSPVINSPFRKPERHFLLNEDGSPTGVINPGRLPSAYFVPIPPVRKKGRPRQAELALEDQGGERVTQNDFINEVRRYVERWRELPSSQWGVTHETARLLLHWRAGEPQPPLFFCQIEAMEADPGDLVIDPTCGSGTTTFVAEQRARRWITIDPSRVALAVARQRLTTGRYAYCQLKDSLDGAQKEAELTGRPMAEGPFHKDIRQGFVYERVPHITLKSCR